MLKIYRASAGSGKTFRLTQDYIHLLFSAKYTHAHRHILAVTFTNKATEEMKSRILEELHLLASGQESNYRKGLMKAHQLTAESVNQKARHILTNILHDYTAFSISTIDRFFQQIIRSFAREIGVYGGYTLELDTDGILEQAVDNLFFDLSEKENAQLLKWLVQFAEERIENAERWDMRKDILSLGYEIFKEKYQHKATETNEKLHNKQFLQAFQANLIKKIKTFTETSEKIAEEALAVIHQHGLQTEQFSGASRSAMKKLERIKNGDFGLTKTFREMAEDITKCYTKKTDTYVIATIEDAYDGGLQTKMQELIAYVDAGILSYNTAGFILKHLNTLGILSDLTMQITKLTVDQKLMLISDSNLLLNRIIDHSDAPFIYEKSGLLFHHFMIDEFQDTSVLQWENFLPLLKNSLSMNHYNLVVGDVKQSIYRWRNSDWNLLGSQVYEDFKHENLQEENLDTNWRSDKNIIFFNNALFPEAAEWLQQKLNENLDPVLSSLPQLTGLQSKITDAYQQTEQNFCKNAGEGHVRFQFIERTDSEGESWKEQSLNLLPGLLEDFQSRGYKPAQVAILVRTNEEASMIIRKLLHHKTTEEAKPGFSYDIMGSEGLTLESAASVRFLLSLLRLFIHPEDVVQKMIMQFEYAKGKFGRSASEAVRETVANHRINSNSTDCETTISPVFTLEENEQLKSFKHYALFEMVENIIALFDLASWNDKEVIFLQAFQDAVYRFSTGKTSDLNAFLQWWDQFGQKQSITTPEKENAFRIMTIHKAKGLSFDAVVMPFCDWTLDSRMRNILWCETQIPPFNALPLMPVEYKKALDESLFAADYYEEMMLTFMDNLNLAYVAFTRPKHELMAICPLPKEKKDGSVTVDSISSLIHQCMTTSNKRILTSNFDENICQIGQPVNREQSARHPQEFASVSKTYPVCSISGRLKLKHSISMLNREEIDITESPLDYGNLMHEIFYNIQTPDDHHALIEEFIRSGRITGTEAIQIAKDVEEFWQLPETKAWFKPGVQVLNETTILTPEGQHYRPDRIILEDNQATVIDYKFGEKELPSHTKQVQNYARLLHEMGYQTQAYLCYVKLKKVQVVA